MSTKDATVSSSLPAHCSPAALHRSRYSTPQRREFLFRTFRAASSSSRQAGFAFSSRRARGSPLARATVAASTREHLPRDLLELRRQTTHCTLRRKPLALSNDAPTDGAVLRSAPRSPVPTVITGDRSSGPGSATAETVRSLPTSGARSRNPSLTLIEPNRLRRSVSLSLNAIGFLAPFSLWPRHGHELATESRRARATTGPLPCLAPRARRESKGRAGQGRAGQNNTRAYRSSPTGSLGQLLRRTGSFSQRVAPTVQSDRPAVGGLRAMTSSCSFLRIHRPRGNCRRASHSVSPSVHRYDGNYLDAPFPRRAPAGRFQNFSPAPLAPIPSSTSCRRDVPPKSIFSTRPSLRPAVGSVPRPSLLVLPGTSRRATVPALRQRTAVLATRASSFWTRISDLVRRAGISRIARPQRGYAILRARCAVPTRAPERANRKDRTKLAPVAPLIDATTGVVRDAPFNRGRLAGDACPIRRCRGLVGTPVAPSRNLAPWPLDPPPVARVGCHRREIDPG